MPEISDSKPVTVTLELDQRQAALLGVLAGPQNDSPDLAGVMWAVLDHVLQGIERWGAWEREWLMQALGDEWLERLERDPAAWNHDRPVPPAPAGPPEWQHQAYGVSLTLPELDDDPVIGGGHADPRRFIAAVSRVAREEWALWRLSDLTRPETAYAAVSHRWAAWTRGEVYRDGEWGLGWVLDWTAAEDAPGAFPVTVLQPDPPRPQAEGSDEASRG